MRTVQCVFLLPITLFAVYSDLRKGRIPNALIVAGLSIGWCCQLAEQGAVGGLLFLGGAGTPIILCAILFYFRMIGAGDIKLFSVIGGFLGPVNVVLCMAASIFAGGILAAILVIYRRNLFERLHYFKDYCSSYLMSGEWRPYITKECKTGRMHFSIPILVGVLCYMGGIY